MQSFACWAWCGCPQSHYLVQGTWEEACQDAYDVLRKYAADHPQLSHAPLAIFLIDFAMLKKRLRKEYEESIDMFCEALAILRKLAPHDNANISPFLAHGLIRLADALFKRRTDKSRRLALENNRDAVALVRTLPARNRYLVAFALSKLLYNLVRMGTPESLTEAIAVGKEALSVQQAVMKQPTGTYDKDLRLVSVVEDRNMELFRIRILLGRALVTADRDDEAAWREGVKHLETALVASEALFDVEAHRYSYLDARYLLGDLLYYLAVACHNLGACTEAQSTARRGANVCADNFVFAAEAVVKDNKLIQRYGKSIALLRDVSLCSHNYVYTIGLAYETVQMFTAAAIADPGSYSDDLARERWKLDRYLKTPCECAGVVGSVTMPPKPPVNHEQATLVLLSLYRLLHGPTSAAGFALVAPLLFYIRSFDPRVMMAEEHEDEIDVHLKGHLDIDFDEDEDCKNIDDEDDDEVPDKETVARLAKIRERLLKRAVMLLPSLPSTIKKPEIIQRMTVTQKYALPLALFDLHKRMLEDPWYASTAQQPLELARDVMAIVAVLEGESHRR